MNSDPTPDFVPPPPSRRVRWRPWLVKGVFESLLIVFSVVLALSLSGWVDDRRTARRVQEMRGYLIAEMQANSRLLADPFYFEHHQSLKRAFAAAGGRADMAVTRQSADPAISQLFAGGLHQAQLQRSVWTSVSSSDLIEHMKPAEVFALSRIYRAQEDLEFLNREGYANAMGLLELLSDDSGAHRHMMRMTIYLEDLTTLERSLIDDYAKTLWLMGAPNGPGAHGGDGRRRTG